MQLMVLGGWMMWPLLAVSLLALAVVIERLLAYSACPLPDAALRQQILEASRTGTMQEVALRMETVPMLRPFARLLTLPHPHKEAALRMAGQQVLDQLEHRLRLLSTLARIAPLMGLLGTITGMINTFSHIAGATAGVDMSMLAEGIWQALLTTATGLIIAIPAHFFLSIFRSRCANVAAMLNEAGNTALMAPAQDTSFPACDADHARPCTPGGAA